MYTHTYIHTYIHIQRSLGAEPVPREASGPSASDPEPGASPAVPEPGASSAGLQPGASSDVLEPGASFARSRSPGLASVPAPSTCGSVASSYALAVAAAAAAAGGGAVAEEAGEAAEEALTRGMVGQTGVVVRMIAGIA